MMTVEDYFNEWWTPKDLPQNGFNKTAMLDFAEMYHRQATNNDTLYTMEKNSTDKRRNVSCWGCAYCDKVSVLKDDKWVLTRTGHCTAENSAVNGTVDFYKKVYVDTIQKECGQYAPSIRPAKS